MIYKHWYDIVISPLLSGLTKRVAAQIPEGTSVLEVGCGTGELASTLKQKRLTTYVGVDLNSTMIKVARSKEHPLHFNFIANDFLSIHLNKEFDYAIFPMVIHSVNPILAKQLIEKAFALSKYVVFADYIVPQPKNLKGLLVSIIERLAGKEHFNNFKCFKKLGGCEYYIENTGHCVMDTHNYEVFRIIVVSK